MNKPVVRLRNTVAKTAVIFFILLIALLPAGYTDTVYGYLPFLALLVLLLVTSLYLWVIRRQIRFETEAFDTVCRRGEKVSVALKIINGSFLICPKARAQLYVSDPFGGDDTVSSTTFTMRGRSESVFSFDIEMKHLGVYTAGVKTLRIYDMTGLFSVTLSGDHDFTVAVLPKTYTLDEIELEDRLLTESRNTQKGTVSDGFDYSGVREYSLGDSMKRIHWKLSAHSSGYMTKITETSHKSDMTVAIDLTAPPLGRKLLANIYDCLIETGLSCVEQALAKEVEHSLVFAGRDQEIIRVTAKGGQDHEKLIRLMPFICADPKAGMPDGADIIEQERRSGNRSYNIILCTANITERLIRELITVKQQQRNPMLCCIIPPGPGDGGTAAISALLQPLEAYGIAYHLIEAEGNS